MHPVLKRKASRHTFVAGIWERFPDLRLSVAQQVKDHLNFLQTNGLSADVDDHATDIVIAIRAQVLNGVYRAFWNTKKRAWTVPAKASVEELVRCWDTDAAAANHFARIRKEIKERGRMAEPEPPADGCADAAPMDIEAGRPASEVEVDWRILSLIGQYLAASASPKPSLDDVIESYSLSENAAEVLKTEYAATRNLPVNDRLEASEKARMELVNYLEGRAMRTTPPEGQKKIA